MIPTRIGQKVEGGFFTGINRIGKIAYAIIVDPKSLQAQLEIKTAFNATPNTQSINDGWANTTNMDNINHPAARYCRTLTAGGYTDRYLPGRNELELCYRYLKPTANSNAVYSAKTFAGNLGLANGTNPTSIPTGRAYTATSPSQTIVTAFCSGSADAFEVGDYWSSTEFSTSKISSLVHHFSDGRLYLDSKTSVNRVRAVRRVEICSEETK